MSATENLKNIFGELVEAYDDADVDAKESRAKKIKDSGKSLRVVIDDELQWEESQVEGYDECPMVVQSITVFWVNIRYMKWNAGSAVRRLIQRIPDLVADGKQFVLMRAVMRA